MKIVIIGAGFTGLQLAKRLVNGKNDVVLIDNDEENVRHASNRIDCEVLCADGNNLETLESAGIAKADALVCVTGTDEVNMITCSLVESVYPDLLKIARVRNYAYYINTAVAERKINAKKLSKFDTEDANIEENRFKVEHIYGIDYMIHPDVEAAQAIVNAVEKGAITEVLDFEDSEYELSRIVVEKNAPLSEKTIFDVRTLTDKPVIIAYIERKGKTFLPNGASIIHSGDTLGVLSKKDDIKELITLCGAEFKKLKKIAIIGAGRIGTIISQRLIKHSNTNFFNRFFKKQKSLGQDLLIIDDDKEKAKTAAENFPEAKVLCGDATDESFIREESIEKSDLVICVTQNHELNVVLGAYLESLGVGKSISLVESAAFAGIARQIGNDVSVPLRDTVVDSIMSHLRGKSVSEVHTVSGGDIEIMEYTLPESSSVNGKPLKDIAESGKFLVLLVKKAGSASYEIPVGNTNLSTDDKVILIVSTEKSAEILRKFGSEEE